jgi:hypothetical protein
LGSKFDEIDSNIPQISSLLRTYNRCLRLQSSTGKTYAYKAANWNATAMTLTFDDMVRAEKSALTLLGWKMLKPTIYSMLECLSGFGLIFTNEMEIVEEVRLLKIHADALEICTLAS